MASSLDVSEVLRRKIVRPTEKSNFSQTCSLLSHYLKEKKGSFGDLLSIGVVAPSNNQPQGEPETCHQTLNLLPNLEISTEASSISEEKSAAITSIDLFPQHVTTEEETPAPAPASQMTIFYAGKVLVFNDFSADKAREIMFLASNGNPQKLSDTAFTPSDNQFNQTNFAASTSNQQRFQLPARPTISDVPIARKASLHRFLEKRKDRISAKAPYLLVNTSASNSSKQEVDYNKMWLDLMASDPSITQAFRN